MRVVRRALSVLSYLSEHPGGATLCTISGELAIPVATAHRTLAVLSEDKFVIRCEETKRYSLGPSSLGLASATRQLADVAHAHMQLLSAATHETVFLTELVGDRVLCIDLVNGKRPLSLSVRVGEEVPVHAAASARCLMAFQAEAFVDSVLASRDLVGYRPRTPTRTAAVKARLALARQRGYDVCDEEFDPNVVAASAPVRAAGGRVVGGVTVAAGRDRTTSMALRSEIRLVRETAAAVSAGLGFVGGAGNLETAVRPGHTDEIDLRFLPAAPQRNAMKRPPADMLPSPIAR